MATVYATIATYTATNALAGNVPGPAVWQTAGYINGREKVTMDFYVALGTETAGTVIMMGAPLPVGAKILAISVTTTVNTGSLTVSVGDLNSATRYASADTGPATARLTSYNGIIDATNGAYVIGSNPAVPTTTNNDQQLKLTTGGATLAAGNIIGCRAIFVTD